MSPDLSAWDATAREVPARPHSACSLWPWPGTCPGGGPWAWPLWPCRPAAPLAHVECEHRARRPVAAVLLVLRYQKLERPVPLLAVVEDARRAANAYPPERRP